MSSVKIYCACDHAAYDELARVMKHLTDDGHEVINHGPTEFDALDDYPEFCIRAAQSVAADPGSLGIVAGGSGNGEQMAANTVAGVRAALAWSPEIARLARQHNNANVLSFGARMHEFSDVLAIVDAFISTGFSGDERHARRIAQMRSFEDTGTVPTSGAMPDDLA